jgi:hypothetical protein
MCLLSILVIVAVATQAAVAVSSSCNSTASATSLRVRQAFTTCTLCAMFFEGCLSDVVRSIQSGATGSCAAICAAISDQLFQTVCTVECSAIGVAFFAQAVLSKNAYPIALCAALYSCAPNTCKQTQRCGSITNFAVSPSVASPGQPISLDFYFFPTQKIGAGEIYTQVFGPGPSDSPVVEQHTVVSSDALWNNLNVTIATSRLQAGVYSGNMSVCAGDCLDPKYGVVMGNRTFTFTLN